MCVNVEIGLQFTQSQNRQHIRQIQATKEFLFLIGSVHDRGELLVPQLKETFRRAVWDLECNPKCL